MAAETQAIVDEIARETTDAGKYSLPEEEIGALAEYEDQFPRSVASQAQTAMGQQLTRYRIRSDAAVVARAAELKVARAGSFTMLRGFSKVGGVLIGQDPTGSADIRDIGWQISGRKVTILLTDAAGRSASFGPFDKSLVHQALAYAADGRPLTVTMTNARPVEVLKILLHPALVDTPLGCRAQQLDRLVDTFAGSKQIPERETMTMAYAEQMAVYNLALAKRRQALGEKFSSNSLKETADKLTEAYGMQAQVGLKRTDLFSEGSILLRKPEFFDPSLVRTAKNCRRPDAEGFSQCVLEHYRSSRLLRESKVEDGALKPEELRTWLIRPATMQPWSGVRERKYQVSADLSFLRAPSGGSVDDRLWPFDFIVQIAFTSSAVNVPEREQEKYVDRQPVEFDQIKGKIQRLVKQGIEDDGFGPQFEDLRGFAILQRMFRAALRGNLGARFPSLKLAQLTDATQGAVPHFHTLRWNQNVVAQTQSILRQAQLSQNTTETWMKQATALVQRCQMSLARAVADSSNRGDAVAACNFRELQDKVLQSCPEGPSNRQSPGCIWKSVVGISEELRNEIAFGVLDDLRQSSRSVKCPSLEVATR